MSDYITVPESEFESIKVTRPRPGRPRDPNSISSKLRLGEVLFLPGWTHARMAGLRSGLSGHRLHARADVRDGAAGLYVWAEAKAATK